MATQVELLEYARECRRQRPQITEEELRACLRAKFVWGVDPLAEAAARGLMLSAIANPLDWLEGLWLIWRGWRRLTSSPAADGIEDIISGVIIILFRDEPSRGQPA